MFREVLTATLVLNTAYTSPDILAQGKCLGMDDYAPDVPRWSESLSLMEESYAKEKLRQ